MARRSFRNGDPVVYCKEKVSTRPGPRARDVHPAERGDDYSYRVDKFWTVVEIRNDGRLVLRTRRGKLHVLDADDPHLRPASLWERLRFRGRFPGTDEEDEGEDGDGDQRM